MLHKLCLGLKVEEYQDLHGEVFIQDQPFQILTTSSPKTKNSIICGP